MSQAIISAAMAGAAAWVIYRKATGGDPLADINLSILGLQTASLTLSAPASEAEPIDTSAFCESGYLYDASNNVCSLIDAGAGADEEEIPQCPKNYKYDDTTETCELDGILNPCSPGFNFVDGNCIDPKQYVANEFGQDKIKTGSQAGDIASIVALSIGASVVADTAVDKASDALFKSSAAAEKTAVNAAEKVETKAITNLATKQAEDAAAKAAEKAAKVAAAKESVVAAKAAKSASIAGKATKGSSILTKLKGTPWSFVIMIIAQVLVAVLGLDPENFESCADGEFDFSTMPDWAKALISALPIVGDLFDLLNPVLCFGYSCDPPQENQNGICYNKPKEPENDSYFWDCLGPLCYAQFPKWQDNGMNGANDRLTKWKSFTTDDAVPLDTCRPGTVQSGALCYAEQPGYTIVAGVAYENCQEGETDTGAFCHKETIDACPAGQWDVGGTCWGNRQDCAADCSKGWDSCKYKWWSAGKCERWGNCPDAFGTNWCAGICDQWGGWECTGGCPDSCYDVPEIKTQLGDRHLSIVDRVKNSFIVNPETLQCRPGYIQQGALCYNANIPPELERSDSHIGFLVQRTPATPPGSDNALIDNGFFLGAGSFTTATYGRGAGSLPIKMRIKNRRTESIAPPRPYCSEVLGFVSDPANLMLCIDESAPEPDAVIDEASGFWIYSCKPTYIDNGETCDREEGTKDPITGEPLIADSYPKKAPKEITWGVY